ncbi:MAG: outer membrane protein assembly factor BamA [Alphaproteobacteria bacterium]|nr:outer membrane protein assembly factor BamA [Alphaproteobacteria bacterium]
MLPTGLKRSAAWVLVLLALVVGGQAYAQPAIGEIRVDGVQRIDPETVRSYMALRVGDPFDADRLDRSLKTLFATGLFADVSFKREGETLVVNVVENPIINRIAFEGSKRIDSETLAQEATLRPRVVYTRTRVQNDVKRILDLYRRRGRFAATVEPKIIQLPQNRVDLVFEIEEGELTGVRRISFVGNKRYGDSTLRGIIQTKETAWYRFLSSDDNYDPDRVSFDRELLRKHYLNNGYADFRVVSAVAELVPERTGFYITFTIEEGERYKFGKVDIKAELKNLDPGLLRTDVQFAEGDWYSSDKIDDAIQRMTIRLGNLGYAFVDIQPQVDRKREERTVNLNFEVREGPKVFVERIDITGNVRTLDKVIRREFRLVEGDAFNAARLQRSRQRVQGLAFFKKAEVANVPGSDPDKTVIKVEVEEKSTGEISFGAGFSTAESIVGQVELKERNLLGRGQEVRIAGIVSTVRREIDFSFTEPYFLDRDVSAGFDLFHVTRDNQSASSYDDKRTGFGLRFGYQLGEALRQTLRYSLREVEILNVKSEASRFIRESAGQRVTSLVGQDLVYDRRDNRVEPTDGYFVRISSDLAGVAGDAHFVRPSVGGGWFYSVAADYVFSLLGQVGVVYGLGENVAIQDRYFIGGSSLRGFRSSGIGPRDITTGDALGGNKYYTATGELTFPLGLPKDIPVLGRAFVEAGSLWGIDVAGPEIRDVNSIRTSVGFGLSINSPLGPIRIDLARPLIKEPFDKTELLRFSFGTRF